MDKIVRPWLRQFCGPPISPTLVQATTEIFLLAGGRLSIPDNPGFYVFLKRGWFGFPDNAQGLAVQLAINPESEWPDILAEEVLNYLHATHQHGHTAAARDAYWWCFARGLQIPPWVRQHLAPFVEKPDWVVGAPPRRKSRGRRSTTTSRHTLKLDLTRLWAARESGNEIEATLELVESKLSWALGGIRRAKGNTRGLKKRLAQFEQSAPYLNPALLLNILRDSAPTLHRELSSPELGSR